MSKRNQMRSKVNGLIIPIPGFAIGVIPRFGIEDNKLVFEQSLQTAAKLDDSVGSVGEALPSAKVSASDLAELAAYRAQAEPAAQEPAAEEPEEVELTPAQKAAETRKRNAAKKAAEAELA